MVPVSHQVGVQRVTGLRLEARMQSWDVHRLHALQFCEVGVWNILKVTAVDVVGVVVPDVV